MKKKMRDARTYRMWILWMCVCVMKRLWQQCRCECISCGIRSVCGRIHSVRGVFAFLHSHTCICANHLLKRTYGRKRAYWEKEEKNELSRKCQSDRAAALSWNKNAYANNRRSPATSLFSSCTLQPIILITTQHLSSIPIFHVYFLFFAFCLFSCAVDEPIIKYAVIGRNLSILCETTTTVPFAWSKNGVNITDSNKR